MAAGANTLEELFEIYKALVKTLAKAGIQIKSSKVEFGVGEITFIYRQKQLSFNSLFKYYIEVCI